jgi:type II secretory pathway pseudopilin PulG
MATPHTSSEQGITLVEVLVAAAILTIVATSLVSVAIAASVATWRARQHTLATVLAAERIEQLRSLAWGAGAASAPTPLSDVSTDLSRTPASAGGPGLTASPASSLSADTPGYVDFLDASGRWVGAGPSVPADAVFVRRWRVSPLTGSADALVLEVVVSPRSARTGIDPFRPDDVRLTTVKARKAA